MRRWKPGDRDTWSWIILVTGAASIILLAALVSAYADFTQRDYDELAYECQEKVWELYLNGEVVSDQDLTKRECEVLRDQLDLQTPPFTPLACEWKYACRQEL